MMLQRAKHDFPQVNRLGRSVGVLPPEQIQIWRLQWRVPALPTSCREPPLSGSLLREPPFQLGKGRHGNLEGAVSSCSAHVSPCHETNSYSKYLKCEWCDQTIQLRERLPGAKSIIKQTNERIRRQTGTTGFWNKGTRVLDWLAQNVDW